MAAYCEAKVSGKDVPNATMLIPNAQHDMVNRMRIWCGLVKWDDLIKTQDQEDVKNQPVMRSDSPSAHPNM